MRRSIFQNKYQGIKKEELRTEEASRIEFSYLLLKDFFFLKSTKVNREKLETIKDN